MLFTCQHGPTFVLLLRGESDHPAAGLPVCHKEVSMKPSRSMVLSMRLPVESGRRLKRIANRHGWTPSDASARLVEDGLRRSEFAFLDFHDSPAGRQAYMQGSTLAVWEVMFLVRSYKGNAAAVAKHLRWPEAKVRGLLTMRKRSPRRSMRRQQRMTQRISKR